MTLVIGIVPLLTVLAMLFLGQNTAHWSSRIVPLGIIGVVVSIIVVWAYSRRIKTWRASVERYEVRVKEGEYISVANPRGSELKDRSVLEDIGGQNWKTLNREEIASMVYLEGHKVLVMGKDNRTIVQLSHRLASFELLLAAVETLGPLERKVGGSWKYQKVLLEYVPAVALIVAFYIDQPLVKLIAGVLAAAGYGFKAYAMFRYNQGGEGMTVQFAIRFFAFVVGLIMAWKGLEALIA